MLVVCGTLPSFASGTRAPPFKCDHKSSICIVAGVVPFMEASIAQSFVEITKAPSVASSVSTSVYVDSFREGLGVERGTEGFVDIYTRRDDRNNGEFEGVKDTRWDT